MTAGDTYFVTVGTSAIQVVGASYRRRAIVFHPPASNRITIGINPGITIDAGPTLQQGQTALKYTEAYEGDLAHTQFFAVASAAGTILGITETGHVD
jgi:hypothetical protein